MRCLKEKQVPKTVGHRGKVWTLGWNSASITIEGEYGIKYLMIRSQFPYLQNGTSYTYIKWVFKCHVSQFGKPTIRINWRAFEKCQLSDVALDILN